MFAQVLAPILGAFFMSLSLINLSSNINLSLHTVLNEHLKQIQDNSPLNYLNNISLYQIKLIYSTFIFISGFVLYFSEGIKRLFVLIPLTILSIYMLQLTIIYGSTLSFVPIYIFLLVCIIIVLFNDCALLEELEIK